MAIREDPLTSGPASDSRSDRWHSPDPPVSLPRPMLFQAWRDCAFLHWAHAPEVVRPLVPRAFELETFDGRAWVSAIAFRIPRMRALGVPPLPGLSSGLETHIRTYVRGPDGRAGIWLLSLDFDPLQGALVGRFGFALPYWWASMDVTRSIDRAAYRSQRRVRRDAALELDLRLGPVLPGEEAQDLDHFVTARWVLYSGLGPVRAAVLTEHPRWTFRQVTVERLQQTITRAARLPDTSEAPLVHFSDGVDARLSRPRPFLALSRG